jgi:hypothetical protein
MASCLQMGVRRRGKGQNLPCGDTWLRVFCLTARPLHMLETMSFGPVKLHLKPSRSGLARPWAVTQRDYASNKMGGESSFPLSLLF